MEISAFGVIHKSQVGGTWKAAKDLSAAERVLVRRGKLLRPEKDAKYEEAREHNKGVRELAHDSESQLVDTVTGKGGRKIKIYQHGIVNSPVSRGSGGFTVLAGGKGKAGGESHVHMGRPLFGDGHEDFYRAHEVAHAQPDRTNYRLHQITGDPGKKFREEARADASVGHFTDPKVASAYSQAAQARLQGQKYKGGVLSYVPFIGRKSFSGSEHGRMNAMVRGHLADAKYAPSDKDVDDYIAIHDRIHGKQRPASATGRHVSRKDVELAVYGGGLGVTTGAFAYANNKERQAEARKKAWAKRKRANA